MRFLTMFIATAVLLLGSMVQGQDIEMIQGLCFSRDVNFMMVNADCTNHTYRINQVGGLYGKYFAFSQVGFECGSCQGKLGCFLGWIYNGKVSYNLGLSAPYFIPQQGKPTALYYRQESPRAKPYIKIIAFDLDTHEIIDECALESASTNATADQIDCLSIMDQSSTEDYKINLKKEITFVTSTGKTVTKCLKDSYRKNISDCKCLEASLKSDLLTPHLLNRDVAVVTVPNGQKTEQHLVIGYYTNCNNLSDFRTPSETTPCEDCEKFYGEGSPKCDRICWRNIGDDGVIDFEDDPVYIPEICKYIFGEVNCPVCEHNPFMLCAYEFTFENADNFQIMLLDKMTNKPIARSFKSDQRGLIKLVLTADETVQYGGLDNLALLILPKDKNNTSLTQIKMRFRQF